MPTIKDVAREAGVSIATVSYVLNNKTNSVSERTRQQVLEAIGRVGYTPNITARNLKASQTRLIGYAWHPDLGDQNNAVMDRFIYCLAHAAEMAGYHLLTFTHPNDTPTLVYDDLIRAGRVDAFVLSGTTIHDSRIAFLLKSGFPFVSFGRSNPEWDFPWVDTDGQRGVEEAVEYLVDLGHQRIAIAALPEESLSGNHRLAGYLEAMQRLGLNIHPEYVRRGKHSEPSGREIMARWLRLPKHERPTAVIAVTDIIAIGIMNEAEQNGLVIGRDLSVIGYDDTPLVQYLRPSLTTLHQPIEDIGHALIAMLERVLHDEPNERHMLLPPRLILRGSCGSPS